MNSATRSVLGRIATNVAVITTGDGESRHGTTANVWAEGTDPPLTLITLDRSGTTLPTILRNGRFAASLLGLEQQPLAVQFARKDPAGDRFDGVSCEMVIGCPVLAPCHGWFACTLVDVLPFGSYVIVTGLIEQAGVGECPEPLLFHDSNFGGFRARALS
jgi:flavin reductase (DIM6/NTAB) family NADH-FMN oxidoreductase RutF